MSGSTKRAACIPTLELLPPIGLPLNNGLGSGCFTTMIKGEGLLSVLRCRNETSWIRLCTHQGMILCFFNLVGSVVVALGDGVVFVLRRSPPTPFLVNLLAELT